MWKIHTNDSRSLCKSYQQSLCKFYQQSPQPDGIIKNSLPGDSKWAFHPLVEGHLTIPKRSPAELPGTEDSQIFFCTFGPPLPHWKIPPGPKICQSQILSEDTWHWHLSRWLRTTSHGTWTTEVLSDRTTRRVNTSRRIVRKPTSVVPQNG